MALLGCRSVVGLDGGVVMSDALLECDSFPAITNTHIHTMKVTNSSDKSPDNAWHESTLTTR